MDRTLTIRHRVRPIRFAFVVSPRDADELKTAIQCATALWGGLFSGIVLNWQRRPKWWSDERSAAEIKAGLISALQPDYLVRVGTQEADVDFPASRILSLDELGVLGGVDDLTVGLTARAGFGQLYREALRFQARDPVAVRRPRSSIASTDLFVRAVFGDFPSGELGDHLKRVFKEDLGSAELDLTADNYFESLDVGWSPLQAGLFGVDVQPGGRSSDPGLFVMDPQSTVDLADFWNLRALGYRLRAIPQYWVDDMLEDCRTYVGRHHGPLRGNPDIMRRVSIVKGHEADEARWTALCEAMSAAVPGSVIGAPHVPRVWDPWSQRKGYVGVAPVLSAGAEREQVTVRNGGINFELLRPEAAEYRLNFGRPGWANVVEISDYSRDPDAIAVLPDDLRDWSKVVGYAGSDSWVSSEGVVVISRHAGTTYWRVPTAERVFGAWMRERGWEVRPSSAGLLAKHLAARLASGWGLSIIADRDTLVELNRMAHGQAEIDVEDGTDGPKRTRGSVISRQKVLWLLARGDDPVKGLAVRRLETLTEADVLRAGLRIQCPECTQHGWYGLAELNASLTCEHCLGDFAFPSATPPAAGWYYRSAGPFAAGDYAHGGYTPALVVEYLRGFGSYRATWLPAFELVKNDQAELEADLAVFLGRDFPLTSRPLTLFCECKSMKGKFEERDVERMKSLGESFPGAIIVFACLRDELTEKEKQRLRALAAWGRQRHVDQTRNPVMILTATELFSQSGAPACWKDSERFGDLELVKELRMDPGPRRLCDITQQLHLDMISYHEWLDDKRLKKRKAT